MQRYEPIVGATFPISTAGSGVNDCTDLGADSVLIIGEGCIVWLVPACNGVTQ